MNITKIINESIEWRFAKIDNYESKAIRLFAGITDGIEGLLIDQFGPFIVATIYNPDILTFNNDILRFLEKTFPKKTILIKARDNKETNNFKYLYSKNYLKEDIHYCHEENLKFEIHTNPRHDYGIYLDTKSVRAFLKTISSEKKVLNLFSYTCAFGIAAMDGKANSVTNIDPNKDYLEWGKRNADINNFKMKRYPDKTEDYLARHLRRLKADKDTPYDITVVDPPAFLVGRGFNRLARNMWPKWMKYLKNSQCKEFIIVINDKSLGRQKDLSKFFSEGLGSDINISTIEQSFDVMGQLLVRDDDPYYFTPAIYYLNR